MVYLACSVTCGRGTQVKERYCNQPSPRFGGAECQGHKTEVVNCTGPPCPGMD